MRIIMMQNEDSPNDLVRQSEALRFLELDQELIRQNFWIETVRGKIGPDAVKVMDELVRWHRADFLGFPEVGHVAASLDQVVDEPLPLSGRVERTGMLRGAVPCDCGELHPQKFEPRRPAH